MKIIDTKFKGLKIIQQKKHGDRRGSLREIFNKKIIKWDELVFDYATTSKKNVLRGFHFQSKFLQAQFVSELSDKNCKSLYIPEGFAHAYFSYSKLNIIYYKLSNYYHPEYEDGLLWNDKHFKIKWPNKKPTVSKKDKELKTFLSFKKTYKYL